jgi:murein L,D-transpeptidase YcbB/YkuD
VLAAAIGCLAAFAPARAAEPDGPAALIGPAEALRITIVTRVADKSKTGAEMKALADYYADPAATVLWVDDHGLTARAKAVMEEIGKADDYGLRASDYALPRLDHFDAKSAGAAAALADAEIKLDLAVLRYARDARGGRFDWQKISPNLDPTLALPDPLQVMESMAIRSDPVVYLRSFQPDQPQFEALRKALIEARGGTVKDDVVRIPDGPVLKVGMEHEQVALLRKRLNVPARDPSKETVFDAGLEEAVDQFQLERGYRPDGMVGPGTRRVLNQQSRQASSPSRAKQILVNMERWRWLPNDLGSFYVTVNIPEFMLKVMEDGKPVFTTRVVVGKPDKQTPIFSNEMQTIVFNPYWNVPNSIKMEELLPAIRAGGGEWLFGGGGGGYDASVFERNGLRVAIGTKEVDPSRLDWSRIDIRSLNVYQPPGPTNVLGVVKFLFPNKHDVYMHDTTQKTLFAKTVRAESHGCMRVQNPEQLATVLLKQDQGWSAQRVASAIGGTPDYQVPLRQKVPVYITYFTLKVNEDGSLAAFRDIYGHDARMAAAMFGEPLPVDIDSPVFDAYAEADTDAAPAPVAARPMRVKQRHGRPVNSIADAISGFLNN